MAPSLAGVSSMLNRILLALLLAAPAAAADKPSTAGPGVRVLHPALEMPGLDRSRTLRLYLPPGYAGGTRRYPVIYMHDGQNLFDDATAYAGEWGVDEALDELAARTGFEAIVVGIDNGGERRMNELSPWPNQRHGAAEGEQYLRFVTEVVKPFVDRAWRTRPDAASTAIIGSSMGGLASLHAIHARPEVFGLAGVLSPSLWFSPAALAYVEERRLPPAARLFVYAGGREGDAMVRDALQLHDVLVRRLGSVERAAIEVADDAEHNEAAWRAVFPRVVAWLYGIDDGQPALRTRPAPAGGG
jgi:predicted alpha/beta superfamily hydrolase